MHVVVIGGGVVGITTAYFLARSGISVTVLEQRENSALECSAGNAGFLSPSDAFAWASPASLKTVLKSLLHDEQAVRFKKWIDPALWRWSVSFLGQCSRQRWENNSSVKYRLASYSLLMLDELRQHTGIDFDESDKGIAYVTRDRSSLKALKAQFSFFQDRGLELEMLDKDALEEKIPALKSSTEDYAGALYSPNCKTGDSLKFSQSLVAWCQQHTDSRFSWGTSVERILHEKGQVTGLWTSKGEIKADAYVLAAGAHSGLLAKPLGMHIPIYPIKGFSITAPLLDPAMAPDMGFDDTQRLVAISRLGDRLRVASSAVFEGFNKTHRQQDFKSMLQLARAIFPFAADYENADYWAGLRPMTPSSVPVLGESPVKNLYLNTGHGHLGWTLACGSARLVADLISGTRQEWDLQPFTLAR